MNIAEKIEKLHELLICRKRVAIAFSGGVDSTFLLKTAQNILGENVIAITANAPIIPKHELKEAVDFTEKNRIEHIVFQIDEESMRSFSHNPENRCYICKKIIFENIIDIALKHNFSCVMDGSNIDDENEYRPGKKALKELSVISPLQECSLTKSDIRQLSEDLGLKTAQKPSFACLASRIPYGMEITNEKLNMIEQAENFLFAKGFSQVRVRHHNDIARIEIIPQQRKLFFDIIDEIQHALKKIGFLYVTLDLKGYRTGSLDEKRNEK